MKQRPESLFSAPISSGYLLYGNNPAIEDYIILSLLPERLCAKGMEIKNLTESELLAVSKEKLYLETTLFDQPKLYIVRDVTDKFYPIIQAAELSVPLVMIGKNLKSSSKLVSYIATHPKHQAVPIYGEDPAFLSAFVQYNLKNYQADSNISGMMLSHLETFRTVQQQVNVVKQLYPVGSVLATADVENILVQVNEISIFNMAETIVSKNPRAMIDIFQKAGHIFQKETIPLLRIIAKQLWDLLALRRQMEQGQTAQNVVSQSKPTIPFQRRPQIIHNLSKWTVGGLLKAIIVMDEIEILAKQPNGFSIELMERYFLQMTKL